MTPTKKTRAELLAALAQLSLLRPEWRLGQTLANIAMAAGRLEPGGVWDLEDEEALAAAKTLIEQFANVAQVSDFTLNELLSKIDERNLHAETDRERAVGKEAWRSQS